MASDDFTDDDSTVLNVHNANWTATADYPVTNLEINSNRGQHTTTWKQSSARWIDSSYDISQIVFIGGSSASGRHVAARMSDEVLGYSAYLGNVSGPNYTSVYIGKNASFLSLVGTGTWATAVDHTVRIQASGTSTVYLDATVDDVEQNQTSDSEDPYTEGSPGFWCAEAAAVVDSRFDDWTDTEAAAAAARNIIVGGGIL